MDDLVGAQDCVAQHDALAHEAGRRVLRAPRLVLDAVAHHLDGRLHGDPARDFARVVAAHAVRQDEQAAGNIVPERIFVVLAYSTGVRYGYELDLSL